MTQRFQTVPNDTVDGWEKLIFPIMNDDPYDLSNTQYYISLGLFSYDTTYLQTYSPDEYARYFASGQYDGWSYGSVFYFEYYQFSASS